MENTIKIFIVVKRKDEVKSFEINEKLNDSEIKLIFSSITSFSNKDYNKSSFIELTKNYNAIIDLNKEKEHFKTEFLKSIEKLNSNNFSNIDIFENYIIFFFKKNETDYIAFKKFENHLKIKKKNDAFFLAWPINDDVKIIYKNANDISIPLEWDFCLSFNEKDNCCYINKLTSINDFFSSEIEDQRIKNFNKFEKLIEKSGFKFKSEKENKEQIKTNSYMRGLPNFRHKDIAEIIKNSNLNISEKQKKTLLELELINSKQEIFITKIKDFIAFLVEKMYSHNKKDWYIADKHTKYQK